MSNLEERVRFAAYLRLRSGRAVGPAELAIGLAIDTEAVQQAIDALASRGAVELDDSGAVIGSGGLTLSETAHLLVLEGVEFHTWCALDAIGIPAALEVDADIVTRCGWCGQQLLLGVERGAVQSDSGLALWLPEGPCTNVREQFCPLANLFCNEEHLGAWRIEMGQSTGRALTVAEAAELGRSWWGHRPTTPGDPPPFG